ncbi:DNA primase [Candidatus Curtissbacteria bacterium]|nr:DNA primase [Candidatus Curtissbacteria bacterium]
MDQVDEVKSKVDIVEIISSYLPLRKAGRNFAALCPFHSEKTPSFMVSPERQVFKCFGCSEAGDVFTFLEKMEGWDFRETLEELAKRVGVKLTYTGGFGKTKIKDKLVEINNLVAKFYAHVLNKHPLGETARKYLKRRGIRKNIWEKFGLGYAPGGWENALNFLTKRGLALEDVATAGLLVSRDAGRQSYYDRFRERLIFPLKDSRGTILGFSGRIIEPETLRRGSVQARNEAKYVNSPETPIFTKGSILFGLDVARGAIRDKGEAILVEGEFDVLSSASAGVQNVIASKGTALTDRQVAIVGRICENVVLCFDTDLAGDAAARRGIELLDLAGVNIRVATLGRYKDPDEFAQKDPTGFAKAIRGAGGVYDYLIDSAAERHDPHDPVGKKKIGKEIMPTLARISDDLVRAHYIEKLAKLLDLEATLVASAIEKKVEDLYVGDSNLER